MKISILVGHAQEATVIITAFNTFESGLTWLHERLPVDTPTHESVVDGNRIFAVPLWRKLNEEDQRTWFNKHCFTSYYDGCGGVDEVALYEINPGEIKFSFSLD